MRRLIAAAAAVLLLSASGGCGWSGSDAATATGGGTIQYWLWDSGQEPGYQKCADAFSQANPGLRVHISQYGWDTYWSKLTAGFIADTAPDVFTDHLSKFAQFVDLKVLRPLDDLGPTADVQDSDYQSGLAELWKGHGLGSDGSGGGGWGQTQWSAFTGSAGWQATDKNPWGTKFNLDSRTLQSTLNWYFGLAKKGYMPTFAEIGGNNAIGPDKQIQSGIAAMALSGSWMISTFSGLTDAAGKKLDIGIAPTPIGPTGKRASMFNGLADSITTLSKQPENAAKWVKFLSGEQCQDIIGQSGVVFPARPQGTDLAIQFNKNTRHLDVTPFTDQVKDKTTFLFPVTTNAADITALLQPKMDSLYIGSSPISSLDSTNKQLDNLFKVAQ